MKFSKLKEKDKKWLSYKFYVWIFIHFDFTAKVYVIFNNPRNVLFLTSDNEFSGIIYSLFRGRQNIFLTIFSTKFVVKCATKF